MLATVHAKLFSVLVEVLSQIAKKKGTAHVGITKPTIIVHNVTKAKLR